MILPARIFRISLGVLFIILGIAGLVLPILPGIYFIMAGMLLLVEAVPAWRARFRQLERRHPRLHSAMQRLRTPEGTFDLTRILIWSLVILLIFGTIAWFLFHFLQTGAPQ